MQTVGEVLRNEREKKGMTVKDIEAATHIRALYISAIEDGDYHVLPGEVYLKGFIRNYANLLGLDSAALLVLYKESLKPHSPEPVVPQEAPDEGAANNSRQESDSAKRATERRKEARSQHNGQSSSIQKWLTMALIAALLAGAGWWYTSAKKSPGSPSPPTVQPSLPSQPALPQPQVPVSPVQPAAKTKPVVVVTKITADCWAAVVVDGKEVFEGILTPGQTRTWEGNDTIIFSIGNAGAVEFTHNGRNIGKIGANGEVVPNYKFTK